MRLRFRIIILFSASLLRWWWAADDWYFILIVITDALAIIILGWEIPDDGGLHWRCWFWALLYFDISSADLLNFTLLEFRLYAYRQSAFQPQLTPRTSLQYQSKHITAETRHAAIPLRARRHFIQIPTFSCHDIYIYRAYFATDKYYVSTAE
jgi:hypothetical protein